MNRLRSAIAPAIMLAVLLALVAQQHHLIIHRAPAPYGPSPASAPAPYPITGSPRLSIELGVSTQALADNTLIAWKPPALRQVDQFEQYAHAHADIVQWFLDWAHHNLSLEQLRAVDRRRSTPEIDWEPWDATKPEYHPQPRYSLTSIIAGRHDAYIHTLARELKAYGKPVLLRFAQEMNGTWYPWSATGTAGTAEPSTYAAAWRHVHDIFAKVGAGNVLWVWSPVSGPIPASLYPGAAYVDIIGVSGFNGGSAIPSWGGWRTFATLVGQTASYLHYLHPGKPIQISEVASTESGGSKALWIAQMFSTIKRLPYITSVVWFNVTKGFFNYVSRADWPIDSSHSAAAAFAAGLRTLAVPGTAPP